jgi:hypothetical protein
MPTNFIPPPGRPLPKPFNNITYALEFNPKTLIINLPSNDAAYNYPISETISNFDTLIAISLRNGVPIWICSPQPRNFSYSNQLNLLFAFLDSSFIRYSNYVIDFWNGIAQTNGFILPQFNSGDGIHLNNAGHRVLYQRASQVVYPTLLDVKLTDIKHESSYILFQNYPNPFNSSSNILFYLPAGDNVSLKLYNILGQEISILLEDYLSAGYHTHLFNGGNIPSGIYYYQLRTSTGSKMRKMVYLK